MNEMARTLFSMQNNLKKEWFFIQMDKKGVELPQSMVVTFIIILLFFVVMVVLYVMWKDQALRLVDKLFEMLGQ